MIKNILTMIENILIMIENILTMIENINQHINRRECSHITSTPFR